MQYDSEQPQRRNTETGWTGDRISALHLQLPISVSAEHEMLRTNLSWCKAWLTTPQSRYMQTVASVCHTLFRMGPDCHCGRALRHTVSAHRLLCTAVSEWVGVWESNPQPACLLPLRYTLKSHGSISIIYEVGTCLFKPSLILFVGVHIFKDYRGVLTIKPL